MACGEAALSFSRSVAASLRLAATLAFEWPRAGGNKGMSWNLTRRGDDLGALLPLIRMTIRGPRRDTAVSMMFVEKGVWALPSEEL